MKFSKIEQTLPWKSSRKSTSDKPWSKVRWQEKPFFVNQLDDTIKGKNYDEIEDLLSYYAVLKEKRVLEQC